MSVTNMNSRMAMAERLSVPQLQQAIQSGSLPAYIGVPLIEQKMKAQKQAAVAQQPESKPIAQEVMEQASGIDSVPSNLPVSGYNEGGIVAFAAGGDVDDDFDYEAYLEQQEESDYDDIIRKYVAEADAAGIEGIPINRTKKVEQKYAEGGIASFSGRYDSLVSGEAPSAEFDPRYEDTEPFDIGAALDQARIDRSTAASNLRGLNPRADRFKFDAGQSQLNQLSDRERKLQNMYSDQMSTSREARPATYADVLRARPTTNGGRNIPPLPNVPYAPPSAVLLPTVTVTPDTASPEAPAVAPPMDMYPEEEGGLAFLGSQTPIGRAAPAGNQGNTRGGSPQTNAPKGSGSPTGESPRSERPKSAFDDFMAEIKASRDDLNKQKSQDKYMALLSAGLGMMSGTSPNAFANIGQGAQMGVASYGASQKQRAAERAALNKNLLMGQRYRSMEDIANRTADINEARYREAAAARAAGAGSASKAEDQVRRQIADMGRLAESRFRTLSANVQKINPYLDQEGHRAAQAALSNDPELVRYNTIVKQLTNKLYGLSDDTPAPTAQSGNKPPLSSFVR